MTERLDAVYAAIDLVQLPSRVRHAREVALPDGVEIVLRIAAGDAEALLAAVEPTGREADFLRQAAEFYVEQVLLAPSSDSYRILGSKTDDDTPTLRRNMALLLRWLHPDVSTVKERSIYARRITAAWDDVKTADRRQAYDASRPAHPPAPLRPFAPPKPVQRRRAVAVRHKVDRPPWLLMAIRRLMGRQQ